MAKPENLNIVKVLELTNQMLLLADNGDLHRIDAGCGVLFGNLRDAAFKIRQLALNEKKQHLENDNWDILEKRSEGK